MRLFEAIIAANHRAVAGDASAGLHPADYAEELPVVALTCVDPRLNAYFPNALALPAEQFIWLRNAGNIVTGPLSSTMRSLALACAVKGGREIAIIGHTDCQICRTPTLVLLDKLRALGVDRSRLPENLSEFFGLFGSERQNVIKACDWVRNSPLIGPKVPIHGLLLDLDTGKLDWLVNGYESWQSQSALESAGPGNGPQAGDPLRALGTFKEFAMGEMKFPETKIGELTARVEAAVSHEVHRLEAKIGEVATPAAEAAHSVAAKVVQYAEKNWPKPPPVRVPAPPPLPAKKLPPPPPIRPDPKWPRR